MIVRTLLVMGLLTVLSGCVDTVDTVMREYRNTTNEGIDAMMMVTTERQAVDLEHRIFKYLGKRYEAIHKRFDIVKENRTKSEFAKEVMESNAVQMYLTELQVNAQRYSMELTRLKRLMGKYVEKERAARAERGEAELEINPSSLCPKIYQILNSHLGSMQEELEKPKLVEYISQFPTWKIVDYDKMFTVFESKREQFRPKRVIQLVR